MSQLDSPYDLIANDSYPFEEAEITNQRLRSYFDECFDQVFHKWGIYPAWTCMECATKGVSLVLFEPVKHGCPECRSTKVFEVATFQGRSARMGSVFESAVRTLFKRKFGLSLRPTPHNTKTHDLEASRSVAIEVKGSPTRIQIPNFGSFKLERAGLLRSDTQKKANANGRQFKQVNPSGSFFVLTNALPPRLRGIRTEDVDAYFDITKAQRVRDFVDEVMGLIGQPLNHP